MAKEMLINVSAGEECRIALLDNGKLQELYMERTSATSHVGNIYKGKVTNVEPSIQAAFVDFGIGRNGFLHISDLMPSYFGKKGGDVTEPVGRKLSRRDRPPIQQCLRKGDEIIVQIIKEGIGTKGPTLSTYLSIPGRVLVMMPGMAKMGISKKIEDEVERARLRKILDGLKPPKDCGFIIRTAGIGKSKAEIERDLKYLARLWEQLKKKMDKSKPPVELYTEGDLVTRTVRDVFSSDVEKIIIDDEETARKVKDFIKLAMPRTKNKVEQYEETLPLFHKYDIEAEIESIYSRRVPLPSGGSLVIDQTEAIVAIDVNSGKFRDHSDAETTAFKTDLEAADEIPRQLKLRDMGGVIICDFIDLRFERHRRELEERLYENLKNDRAKTRMLRMSQFGIIEMTRQRMRPSLKKSIYTECNACRAHGMVKTPESMSLDVMRKLRIAAADGAVVRILLTVHPEVAAYMQNRKRAELATLEDETQKRVIITADTQLPTDEVKFELYDSRDGYIYIAELGMALPAMHQQNRHQGGGRPSHGRDRDRDRDRNQQSHKSKHDRRDDETEALDAEELFSDEGGDEPKKEKEKASEKAEKKPVGRGRGRGRGAKAEVVAEPEEAVEAAGGEAIEQTGSDDEASVVEIDEGGSELPGHAPGTFFEPNDHRRDDRDQGGRRRRRRGRRGRGRGGDQGYEGGSGQDQPQNDDRDNREPREDDDNREPQGDNREPRRDNREPQGDNREPRRDNREPQGDNRGPRRDNREPQGDNRGPRRDNREPQGDNREPRRDNREPRRDNRDNRDNRNVQNQYRNDRNRNDQPRGDQPRNDQNRNDQNRNDRNRNQGRDDRNRNDRNRNDRFDRNRGDRRDQREPRNAPPASPTAPTESDVDYEHPEYEAPAPGNELTPDTAPQAHLQRRDERAVGAAGAGGRRGRRGGRGRGRGGPVHGSGKSQQKFDRTGLPDDEELEREARELELRQAQLAAESETAEPIDEMDAGSDEDNDEELSDADLTTPIPAAAPAPMGERGEDSSPARGRTRSSSGSRRVPPPQPDVVKTGSVDKHLADDEPADHEAPRSRPTSYRDLDELPDYDE